MNEALYSFYIPYSRVIHKRWIYEPNILILYLTSIVEIVEISRYWLQNNKFAWIFCHCFRQSLTALSWNRTNKSNVFCSSGRSLWNANQSWRLSLAHQSTLYLSVYLRVRFFSILQYLTRFVNIASSARRIFHSITYSPFSELSIYNIHRSRFAFETL
jgi:hypothetical protein